MASIIPKIRVGLGSGKREKLNWSFDNSTSANIGSIQPTMCREMVPNSKINVKVSSLVRLASMPAPTFGRMSLRHYHAFVPIIDLWQPFDAMMSGQHYKGSNSATFIPTSVPYFQMKDINPFILQYSDISIAPAADPNNPYTITTTNVDYDGNVYEVGEGEGQYPTMTDAIKAAQAYDLALIDTAWNTIRTRCDFGLGVAGDVFPFKRGGLNSDDGGVLNLGSFFANPKYNTTSLVIAYPGVSNPNVSYVGDVTPIMPEGADLITYVTNAGNSYYVYLKFKPFVKRLRTILIGLGYQFSPYNNESLSVLKLLAYYKAYFNQFMPTREKAFIDTECYYLIKRLSEVNGVNAHSGIGSTSHWEAFIEDLANAYYYLPMDYYSMSVLQPQKVNQDSPFEMYSAASTYVTDTQTYNQDDSDDKVKVFESAGSPNVGRVTIAGSGNTSPLTIQLAMRMLKWANKNTVIGRSVREYLKIHFGVQDINDIDSEEVYKVGSSRTNIQISDVMSTAESQQGYLGEYGGKGIGYSDSEKFDFTADKFGYWITMTAVIPESGYYQGYLKENRHLNRYQFFNNEFDAVGYQVLERGEVMDDYNCDGPNWNPATGYSRTKGFGLVPRYSEYKVGRNIVNGDLSLIGLYNSMAPYTLDRRLPGGKIVKDVINSDGTAVTSVVKPDFVPTIVYDNFRRIDPTDHLGQYNRIFNYGGNDLDHFIIHNVFDVEVYAPMKSLSNSFDAVVDGERSVDVTHS